MATIVMDLQDDKIMIERSKKFRNTFYINVGHDIQIAFKREQLAKIMEEILEV